ncbi:lysophospholipid acyltransferase family protein [Aliarcobacter skirrowii]|uniref:1-acyl-sn-glycerol-3-phosphate acyltransferase n=1 Tax=Aliarcobacter skirrowii CCUG 10374 TaxID=1032239 RepID=A0AAD0SNS4_9BACT|nr:lysophospholipid acyltransferase family protein [Aliarcobacter skirrowii]AXX85592.1 1-acylglycerol-3-phosphate O-acyltransferase [Aliarcobacter skirrowii CCUG 10374]KAB0620999.1 1-acyl-sn-glycerol-3-phosphate acyltransferase [Aliarcobacter skirrowii CCUG 10374]MDD3025116.1 lysophospholipid acyltransferase family protein [Aliarcobacter skirrowii]RXI26172.1 1-acyl-sn-glycerol-3-phosphate acyltransferase [Aliarcobacter skirrowii CCUG 10374]SUU95873.1 1-acyl-sn-glycerol-3-phosphate acyltransfer
MKKIRGLFVAIQFSITVAFVIFFMYIFRNNAHKVIKIWMTIQMYFLGIKLEIEGKLDESCDLILINHQSMLDIIVMEYIHKRNIAWVAKKQITDMFFFGHIIKAPRMISIDRENKAGLIHLLSEAKDRLDKGRPIAIFPEGTRGDGTFMGDFKAGAKMLGNKYNLKVQPVVMFNTRNIVDSKRLEASSGVVKVVFLEPVQASKDSSWYEDTEKNMKEVFYKEYKNYVS